MIDEKKKLIELSDEQALALKNGDAEANLDGNKKKQLEGCPLSEETMEHLFSSSVEAALAEFETGSKMGSTTMVQEFLAKLNDDFKVH